MIYSRVTHNQRPTYHDIVVYQGATFTDDITVRNVDGTAFNLIGYSARGRIRKSEASGSDTDLTLTVTSASEGKLTMSLSSTQTTALETINKSQTWTVYDVEIYDTSDPPVVYRILQGQVLIEPEVTV